MINTRTPFRITLFGGGTDYPEWYKEFGGKTINACIDKYCYISIRDLPPFFNYKWRLRYFITEEVSSISEIKHPSIKESLKYFNLKDGLEIVHQGDLPSRSGLGSSSAFTVGMVNAISGFQGKVITKRNLALTSINIEQNKIGEAVGSQDQVAAAYGGFNYTEFSKENEFSVTPISLDNKNLEKLQSHLLLCFTGLTRNAAEIAATQIEFTKSKKIDLKDVMAICDEGYKCLSQNYYYIAEIGRLLDEQWKIKKNLTKLISNSRIDEIYEIGKLNGAMGGKLLGAGGGGFMLFIADPKYHLEIKRALSEKMFVPFKFDFDGSKIIYQS
ncbi:kinase [Alphaproteobacteria bacterium]|nr:kinase [Alphaproteobacteria bacterium]